MAVTAIALESAPLFINGEFVPSKGRTEMQCNPATGLPTAMIPYSTADEVNAAVAAARAAFPGWSTTPVLQRSRVLFKFRELLEKHRDELIALVTEENGKIIEESRGSFQRGLEAVEFACGAPSLMMGETIELVGSNADGFSIRKPIGPCVGITPFNFPLMVPLWMWPVAIACGNTFILKPSEKVPRCSIRTAELIHEAGLPKGVLNVVHGGKEVVDQLCTHKDVVAVSFVGSSAVAKHVYTTAASAGKRVQALGGAKNHSVVMSDCELKSTVDSIMASSFGCAGERCVATSVVVAVGEIGDKLVDELKKAADSTCVGCGDDPATQMGPVITPEHKQKILGYIEAGEKEGAKLVRDGRGVDRGGSNIFQGNYVGPTIFDHADPGMKIVREEIFGPVLSVVRAKDLKQAVEIVGKSEFGNAASIYTRSGAAAREFTTTVTAGMVGINIGVPAPVAIFPFAGWKGSFYGDLHALGKDGVRFYTESKVVTCRWPD
jgi:malonate-semialdehyde dehydrogenase (acetylating)/methylmalonate-semialdehyde dehydrogenase